mgnify:CR=1 FL=1
MMGGGRGRDVREKEEGGKRQEKGEKKEVIKTKRERKGC